MYVEVNMCVTESLLIMLFILPYENTAKYLCSIGILITETFVLTKESP